MMPFRDVLWRIKIAVLSRWNRWKNDPSGLRALKPDFKKLKSLDFKSVSSFVKNVPPSLRDWDFSTAAGKRRGLIAALLLAAVFGAAAASGYFIADDGFVSFRYVSNAAKGAGFVWNVPPFRPVSGFGSFLWLVLLRCFWFVGIKPPLSADLMTFSFSIGCVLIGFFFLRRADIQPALERKSLLFFVLYAAALLTNRTFLGFFWSGTEAALFNFLVLLWVYLAAAKNRNPVSIAATAVLLSLTHWEGFVFLPFTLILAAVSFGKSPKKAFSALLLLCVPFVYLKWLAARYGVFPSTYFSSFHTGLFPVFWKDYIGSFAVEFALYYWLPFIGVWLLYNIAVLRGRRLKTPLFLTLVFTAYVAVYAAVRGAEPLEYKPFSFFIPLTLIAMLRILTENFTSRIRTVVIVFAGYLIFGSLIPALHSFETKGLETRRETAYLYKPVPEKFLRFTPFGAYWNAAQRRLIYQGAGLRLREHRVFYKELAKSLPTREEGEKVKPEYRRIASWNTPGQIAWIFPHAFIIDTSGQNDFYLSTLPVRLPGRRRLLGREKDVPPSYLTCFAGSNNLRFTPFGGKPDYTMVADIMLTDGLIKSCEKFWGAQIRRTYKAGDLVDPSKK